MSPLFPPAQSRPTGRGTVETERAARSAMNREASMRACVAVVLAGGRGSRLHALTDLHAKPAMSIGAMYRMIDFTLANCVNSGLRRICVLTQYRAQSLIRHLQDTWTLNRRLGEFVDPVPAQQRVGDAWYQGTADAVFQNLDMLVKLAPDHVFVLGGDHLYKMDYASFLADHVASGAEATLACVDVDCAEASPYGVVQVDACARVSSFTEKPARPEPRSGSRNRALISMGIYVFNVGTLVRELQADAACTWSQHDFGRDVLPRMLARGAHVQVHDFGRSCVRREDAPVYWRDVGTLDGYWETSMDLARGDQDFELPDSAWPVPASAIASGSTGAPLPLRILAGGDGRATLLEQSLLGCACTLGASTIRRSVISSGVQVGHGVEIEDSVVLPCAEIADGVRLRRVIVDSHCRLPPSLVVGYGGSDDESRFHMTARGIALITPALIATLTQLPH